MTDNQEIGADPALKGPSRPQGFAAFMRLPGVKFVLIGIITMLLLVPTLLVWALVEERAQRADEVASRIANGWGQKQTINGPYLAVPMIRDLEETSASGVVSRYKQTSWVLLMPETLDVKADLQVEDRKLSIYSLPVYNAKVKISGRFQPNPATALAEMDGTPDFTRAFLVMHIADITGVRSNVDLMIDGVAVQPFEPGMRSIFALRPGLYNSVNVSDYDKTDTGIHGAVEQAKIEKGFSFAMNLSLNGSSRLSVAPAGQTTSLAVAANWADPGFEGQFLPETKTISAEGFKANWTIPYLARGVAKISAGDVMPFSSNVMQIGLVQQVKFYQLVSRTLKYSIGFVSLVFFAVFILELKGGRSVHWVQYVLTGLALIIFYILLLALSEHVGFGPGYAVAACATTLLISFYVGSVTQSRKSGLSLATVLGLSYGVLYLVMREDEYALLAGALISFVTIAATMYFTRNIDWSGRGLKD
ncbi:cell envelope integrity protein CreD [Rhizobium alvei]|uniref:Cell envelope integrity protein CreD n=1 Tax=Rhizobium alvei TaxID=1132659 RepID=A0ABT8YJ76_9HYPH|nr:cell envelope integrity protein CreD [Rhizobium alvei]MDO6963748.1 cell envelope integrity protein CreD [Rhizobium alvei]